MSNLIYSILGQSSSPFLYPFSVYVDIIYMYASWDIERSRPWWKLQWLWEEKEECIRHGRYQRLSTIWHYGGGSFWSYTMGTLLEHTVKYNVLYYVDFTSKSLNETNHRDCVHRTPWGMEGHWYQRCLLNPSLKGLAKVTAHFDETLAANSFDCQLPTALNWTPKVGSATLSQCS